MINIATEIMTALATEIKEQHPKYNVEWLFRTAPSMIVYNHTHMITINYLTHGHGSIRTPMIQLLIQTAGRYRHDPLVWHHYELSDPKCVSAIHAILNEYEN